MATTILLLEDDLVLRRGVAALLEKEGYRVLLCDGVPAFNELRRRSSDTPIDLYILDVCLPGGDGFSVCRTIREASDTPILMLTVLDDEANIIEGLRSGADDYVTKPFSLHVLKYRLRALLRRGRQAPAVLHSGDYTFRVEDCTVYRGDTRVELLPKEFQIARLLLSADGCLVTRQTLLEKIWEIDEVFVDDNTLSVHMSRLRKKLGKYLDVSYIRTERGFGYRWGVEIEKEI